MVTPGAVPAVPDAAAMAEAPLPVLETIIAVDRLLPAEGEEPQRRRRPACVERFGGEVPRTIDELITLPGVARKTANVVLGTAFGIAEGVVVDTHVQRLAMRLGLTRKTDPEEDRARADEGDPPGPLDPLLPPADLARPPRLLRAQAGLRRLPAGPLLSQSAGLGACSGSTASSASRRSRPRRTRRSRRSRGAAGSRPGCPS